MKRTAGVVLLASVTLVLALSCGGEEPAAALGSPGGEIPTFEVDPDWPTIPDGWVLGQVASVAVDSRDHVWVLQRPGTLEAEEMSMAAPPVLEFDPEGNFVQGWGGPNPEYHWPQSEHGIFVDHNDYVWVGGNGREDQVLKFTMSGELVMQIGRPGESQGNRDTQNLGRPADVWVHPPTNELFIADGYGNRRVIVYDADTGEFKRMWGAFGDEVSEGVEADAAWAREQEGPGPPHFAQPVHAAKVSDDGLVYVSDRGGKRVQVFTLEGEYVSQVFIGRECLAPECGNGTTAASTAFSSDPEQRFLYVGNRSQARVMVLDRETLEILDSFGKWGSAPGDFGTLHHMDVDSRGNLYVTEVTPLEPVNRRVQKFTLTGMRPRTAMIGQVTSAAEGSMEGVVVTAKREGSTIAVSVISDAQGRYRFPAGRLEAGRHTLSIRAVGYDLEAPKMAEVGASGVATVDLVLGPTRDLEAQLTNAEWLESIPGTEAQKRMFESCVRCHTIDRVMRSHYDADAWLRVLERMDGYVTSAFPGNPQRRPADQVTPFAERSERQQEARRRQADYLASINLSSGERAYDLVTFPRPTGRATQVIITEYDLPNPSTAPHDAEVDPDGMVWYVDFGQQYLGKLDPRTGEVTEYQVPEARPGNPTGILALKLDRDGNPWGGNMFQGSIFKFDRQTEKFRVWKVPDELEQPKGRHGTRLFQINHAAPESSHVDGKVWLQNRSIAGVHRLDLATGEFESFEPFLNSTRSSHNLYGIEPDSENNLWFMDFSNEHIGRIDAKTGEITLYETPTLGSRPRRGGVDSQDRIWYAGFGGNVIGMFDPRTEEFQEWHPPTPRTKPYDTVVDRNGDVWTGSMFTDRVVRLIPGTGEFIEYLLPEKGVNIRRVFVDDSTTPVTFWIGSNHSASLIALQALDGK